MKVKSMSISPSESNSSCDNCELDKDFGILEEEIIIKKNLEKLEKLKEQRILEKSKKPLIEQWLIDYWELRIGLNKTTNHMDLQVNKLID